MANVSYPFKKTNKTAYNKPSSVVTQDSLYWKKLSSPVLVKEFGAIDYLDFSPVEPYYFAATCSVRVQVYDPITKVVAKNISKFVEAAYGACFRTDGRLLITGSEEAAVKLFDVQSKNVLRVFTGHTGPVHRTFFTKDQVKAISFSDDKSVCLWDIATEAKISSFTEHNDYVRSGAPSPVSPEIILSGSYDHTVKLYDCRSNQTVLSVNHGSPVESTIFLPSGGIFISAGGTEIKVWDIFNGGKLLANISQHHKTVTTLRLASNNSKILSSSLDRHVKIYDVATFKVVHTIDFPNAVLSMAISKHDDVLVVGMVDGIISIRKKEKPSKKSSKAPGSFKFAPDQFKISNNQIDLVVLYPKVTNETPHDQFLRKMEFGKALSTVLRRYVIEAQPEETAAIIQELSRRKVLYKAMAELGEKQISQLLKFFTRNLGETRFTRSIIDAANVFVDVFENQVKNFSEENIWLYKKLLKQIKDEIGVCKKVSELEGTIHLLLASAQVDTNKDYVEGNDILAPSSKAQKDIIIDV